MLALLMLVFAIAAAPMVSSADECGESEIARVCVTDDGVIVVDGAEGNEDPLDGYVTIDVQNGEMCADSDGNYDDPDADPNCYSL